MTGGKKVAQSVEQIHAFVVVCCGLIGLECGGGGSYRVDLRVQVV
jgi:hypothetical protein